MDARLVPPGFSDRDWAMLAGRLHLSPQQAQIVKLIIDEGLTDERIALRLGIARRSVKTQIERLFAKLSQGQSAVQAGDQATPRIDSRVKLVVRVFREVLAIRKEQLQADSVSISEGPEPNRLSQ